MSIKAATSEFAPPETPQSVWSPHYRLLTLGIILVVAGAAFEAISVSTILPATVRELGGISLYGWVFSAFMLTNLIGLIFAGTESDRQGPVRPFIVGVTCFTAGLVTAGFAPSMEIVIVGRTVQGFGAGTITAVAYVIIGRGYPADLKPRMLALLSSAWVIPGLFGPALAGLIADHLGWRWVFLGLALLPLLATSLALPAMRRLSQDSPGPRAWRRLGTVLGLALGAGMVLLSLDLQQPLLIAALLIPGGILGIVALRSLLPPGTLRAAPGLPAAMAAMGLLNLAFFGVDSFVPLELTAIRGQTITIAGLTLTAATLCWTTGAWLQAHFAKSQKRCPVVLIGLAFIALGIGMVAAVLIPSLRPLRAKAPEVPCLLAPLPMIPERAGSQVLGVAGLDFRADALWRQGCCRFGAWSAPLSRVEIARVLLAGRAPDLPSTPGTGHTREEDLLDRGRPPETPSTGRAAPKCHRGTDASAATTAS